MVKTVDTAGKISYLNPVGLQCAEPFQEKAETKRWFIRWFYQGTPEPRLTGSYSDEQTACNIIERLSNK